MSDVSLKLNGHKIICSVSCNVGIFVQSLSPGTLKDIQIVGPGLVRGFSQDGLFLNRVADSEVRDVTLLGNSADGIFGQNVSGLRLTGNVAGRNGGGIGLLDSTGNFLYRNDASGNSAGFILTGTSSRNTLEQNRAEGNINGGVSTGIGIAPTSTNNIVHANITNGNQVGIHVLGTANTIQGNTSLANSNSDMQDDNPSCDSNHWRDNTFFTSSPSSCIH